jgi:hypothetical protein
MISNNIAVLHVHVARLSTGDTAEMPVLNGMLANAARGYDSNKET